MTERVRPLSDREMLQKILSSELVSREDLEFYLTVQPKEHNGESHFVEFKDSKWFDKPEREKKAEIRKYISGFANAEGGLLVFGVHDDGHIDPVTSTKHADFNTWVTQITRPLVGYIGFSPRVLILPLENGSRLIYVATPRALVMVPVVSKEKPHISYATTWRRSLWPSHCLPTSS